MIQLDPQAEGRLNEYLWQVRESLRRCTALDAAEVESDVRQHIERELEGAKKPVTLDGLQAVLEQLGSPEQWSLETEVATSRETPQHLAGLNPLERIEVTSDRFRRSLVVAVTAFVASIFIFAVVGHVANIAHPPTNLPDYAHNYLDFVGRMIKGIADSPVLLAFCPLLPVLLCLLAAHQYTDIDRHLPLRRFRIRPVLSIVGVPLLTLAAIFTVIRLGHPAPVKRVVRELVGIVGWGSVSLVPWLAYAYAFRLVMVLLREKLGAAGKPVTGRAAAWTVYAVGVLLVPPLVYALAKRFGNGDGQAFMAFTAGLGMLILVAVGLADLLYGDVPWLALRRRLPSSSSRRRFHLNPAE